MVEKKYTKDYYFFCVLFWKIKLKIYFCFIMKLKILHITIKNTNTTEKPKKGKKRHEIQSRP